MWDIIIALADGFLMASPSDDAEMAWLYDFLPIANRVDFNGRLIKEVICLCIFLLDDDVDLFQRGAY